jgi:hypothetical protein
MTSDVDYGKCKGCTHAGARRAARAATHQPIQLGSETAVELGRIALRRVDEAKRHQRSTRRRVAIGEQQRGRIAPVGGNRER